LVKFNQRSLDPDSRLFFPYDALETYDRFGSDEERKEYREVAGRAGHLTRGADILLPLFGYIPKITDAIDVVLKDYSRLESGLLVPDWLASKLGISYNPFNEKVSVYIPERF
jgi:hypothetical protein